MMAFTYMRSVESRLYSVPGQSLTKNGGWCGGVSPLPRGANEAIPEVELERLCRGKNSRSSWRMYCLSRQMLAPWLWHYLGDSRRGPAGRRPV